MLSLLTQPEMIVALLGILTSSGFAIRGLPAVLERLAAAREKSAQAELVDAESHAKALASATARALAAEERAAKAESRAAALGIENAQLREAINTHRPFPR